MFAPLKLLLDRIIQDGNLTFVDCRGQSLVFGNGEGPPVVVALKDRRTEWRLARDPELAAGEAYVEGRLVMRRGSVYDFIELAMRNIARHPLPEWAQAFAKLRNLKRRRDENNEAHRARQNVQHHYDIDPRIYDLFLDSDRQYSCAYFAPGIANLDDAQRAKQRHIAAKLDLKSGLDVLDIGCGWGGFARYLADAGDVRVKGITLSSAQLARARAIKPAARQRGRVEFELQDYRADAGRYDRIVSVGMFEHVGLAHYATFFRAVSRLLKDDGVALVHAIGRLDGPAPTNPFVAKYIFPGGSLASLSEVTQAIEGSGLLVTDIEILRLHYAETLRQWRRRFLARRAEAVAIAGENFARLWEFYLAGCEAAFRHQFLMVFQVQLAKRIESLPLTRDYMAEAERRLAERERRAGTEGLEAAE